MKKILALALAFVMVMGLASVAFAADPVFKFNVRTGGVDGDKIYNEGSKDEYKIADGRYVGVENEDGLIDAPKIVNGVYAYERGDTIYVALKTEGGEGEMDAKTANKWKVKADWKVGGDMVDSVEIEYKKFAGNKKYDYVVAIKTNTKTSTSLEDLVGILSLYTTSPSSAKAENNQKVMFAVSSNAYATYGIKAVSLGSLNNTIEQNSDTPVVSFSGLDEEVITFEGVGEFEINLYAQGKLYLGFNTDFNKEIADKYPEAELEFVNFVGKPAFNKWGVFYLYADEDNKYVYEMNDGVISKVDATWDESMGAYRFAAKRFDTFITSDVELDLSAQGTTEGGDKTNPSTGR